MTKLAPTKPAKRSAKPGRFALAPPKRRRGQETLDLFVAATEALLEERTFEQITVQEIALRAGRPIGSFYARFASKDALLPCLYARYDRDLESYVGKWFAGTDWPSLDLVEAVREVVRGLVSMYLERRWLLRAMALFARSRPEAIPEEVFARRGRVFDHAARALESHHRSIAHVDPAHAVRFGLFVVMSVAREKLLFGEAPHARVTPMTRAELERELARTLCGYLGAAPGSSPPRPGEPRPGPVPAER